jgi:CheY-like chemotaxis protein
VEIQVCDTGKGIDAGSLDEIFEEFKQIGNDARQKAKGLGLGLAIVQRIAALLGHPISVASTVKRGTVFSIMVPRVHSLVAHPEPRHMPKPILPLGRRILLVEDDGNVLRATEAALHRWGLTIDAHADSESVLAHGIRSPFPDALIVDYRLPGAFNGLDLISHIRDLAGTMIPAILITGEASLPATNLPASLRILQKPILPDRLQGLLAELWETGF